jgi:hypothetical protein
MSPLTADLVDAHRDIVRGCDVVSDRNLLAA